MRLSKARKKGSGEAGRAKQVLYNDILTEAVLPRKTWSARMPAYCFTALCPDARYRPEGKGG